MLTPELWQALDKLQEELSTAITTIMPTLQELETIMVEQQKLSFKVYVEFFQGEEVKWITEDQLPMYLTKLRESIDLRSWTITRKDGVEIACWIR